MGKAGKTRLRLLVTAVNFSWAVWALLGGTILLNSQATLGVHSTFRVFHAFMRGYEITGISLLICGLVSLFSLCFAAGQKVAAILCAVWCFATAMVIQFATPGVVDQGDIDAWLLVMCGVSCVGRWALLVMEPHVEQ